MDTLKAQLATIVRNQVIQINRVGEQLAEPLVLSDLQTRIRILTPAGPRYFLVQVKEEY